MKRFAYLYILIALLAGCQDFVMDFPRTAPYASTGDVVQLDGTSVTLSGSFKDMESDAAVLCFYVSENEDFYDSYEYMLDIRVYETFNDAGNITAVFDDLMPNRKYYYKFGIIHGKLENDRLERVSESESWGEVKTFETEKVVPKIKNILYNDYSYSYKEDSYSQVKYDLTVELDSPISGYVDQDCTEYGFYAVAADGSFKNYISNLTLLDSGRSLRFSIIMDKEDYTISRSPEYCYAITSKCSVGLYMMDGNGGMNKFAEMDYPGFEYTLQPRIEIVDLKQGDIVTGDFGDEDHNWDRKASYEYSIKVEGALFFDTICEYYYGNWTTPGRDDNETYYYDGERPFSYSIRFYSTTSGHTDYIFYLADIDDFEVLSYNSIKMYFNGYGGCEITTSYYVPTPSYSQTKSSSIENCSNIICVEKHSDMWNNN